MKEDSGRILEVLDHLDPALIEGMDGQTTAKRRPAPVRVALAAACICALLVTAAIAAEVMGFDFVKIFNTEEAEETDLDYMVDGSGVRHIPLSALSQEAQALKEQYEDRDDGYVCTVELAFDSWEEAEEYLGYEIMDNPVLAQGTYGSVSLLSKEGDKRSANCWIKVIFGDDGEITYIQVFSRMNLSVSPNGYMVEATLYVRETIEDLPDGPIVAYKCHNDSYVEGKEDYLTPDGLEIVIVTTEQAPVLLADGSEYRGGEYDAHFFLRGIRFSVWADYPEQDRETALTELKQVLDAFE